MVEEVRFLDSKLDWPIKSEPWIGATEKQGAGVTGMAETNPKAVTLCHIVEAFIFSIV